RGAMWGRPPRGCREPPPLPPSGVYSQPSRSAAIGAYPWPPVAPAPTVQESPRKTTSGVAGLVVADEEGGTAEVVAARPGAGDAPPRIRITASSPATTSSTAPAAARGRA